MFFELAEIQRLDSQLHQLQSNKNQLVDTLSKSYANQNTVRGSMDQTIQHIIQKAKNALETVTNIEDEAENGFLVPEQFDIEQLLYEKGQLPEWFEFVFKKEFSKQKKSFDVTAKKMYKMNGLREKKNQLAAEIKSFEILYGRYQSLGSQEQNCLNIMAQAQTLKNKTRFVKEKYVNFVHLISSKIVAFLEENISRSLNFSTQIQTFSHYNSIPDVSQPQPKLNIPPPPQPPSFLYEGESMHQMRRPYKREIIQTTGLSDYGRSVQPRHYCRNHSNYGKGEMRFNYKDYMNRWMGKTFSDYYI